MIMTRIPWHIKTRLIKMAFRKVHKSSKQKQICHPVRNSEEFKIENGKVFYFFNTLLEHSKTHSLIRKSVNIPLVNGQFPN